MSCFVSEHHDGTSWVTVLRHTTSVKEKISPLTPAELDSLFSLATTAFQSAKSYTLKDAIHQETQRIREESLKELSLLRSKMEKERRLLETQIEEEKAAARVADTTASKLREQLAASTALFTQALETAGKQKEAAHEKELARFEAVAERRLEELKTQLQAAQEKLSRQLVSSNRGSIGEKEFDELVAEHTSWGPLQNVGKQAHSTDRSGIIRGCEVRFELKNYTADIPSAEVKKFERDMEEHHNIPYGVFISLRTPICGKKQEGFVSLKWTPRNQLLLFVSEFYSHTIPDVLSVIEMCADVAWSVYKTSREMPSESERCVGLERRIEEAKVYVEREIKQLELFSTTLTHDKKFLLETLTTKFTQYQACVKQSCEAMKSMVAILLGDVSPIVVESSSSSSSSPISSPSPSPSPPPSLSEAHVVEVSSGGADGPKSKKRSTKKPVKE